MTAGKYLGQESISINGSEENFFAIYDPTADSKFFIPLTKQDELNILPTKEELTEKMEKFNSVKMLIKVPKGSTRFVELTEALAEGSFDSVFAATHDLNQLKLTKKISHHEKQLFEKAKKVFVKQISVILEKSESVLHMELFGFS